jgi:hypothetical protein
MEEYAPELRERQRFRKGDSKEIKDSAQCILDPLIHEYAAATCNSVLKMERELQIYVLEIVFLLIWANPKRVAI